MPDGSIEMLDTACLSSTLLQYCLPAVFDIFMNCSIAQEKFERQAHLSKLLNAVAN